MSSYIYVKVFNVNREDNSVQCFLPDIAMNSLKSLAECRSRLEIDPLYNIPKIVSDKIEKYTEYTDDVYVATINKTDLEKLKEQNIDYTIKTSLEDEVVFLKLEDDIEKVKSLNVDTGAVLKHSDKFYVVYFAEKKHFDGELYNEQCFESALMDYENKLEKLFEKKVKCNQALISVDYMKLSSEEKENVNDEMGDIDEDIIFLKSKIAACQKVLGLFEVAFDYDYETLIFVYEC